MAKKKKAARKTPKKAAGAATGRIGDWTIRRTGDRAVELTLPQGMVFTGEVSVADVLAAIAISQQSHERIEPKCCSGNVAIA